MSDELKVGEAWLARVDDLLVRANFAVIDDARVADFVVDAEAVLLDVREMLRTLSAAQSRGSELQDEVRALRRLLRTRLTSEMEPPNYAGVLQSSVQLEVLVDLLKVRWRGDAKYGTAEAHADLPLMVDESVREFAREQLTFLRKKKREGTGYRDWLSILTEEWFELMSEDGSDEARIEAEAVDVANVCLKMVESRRVARSRVEAKQVEGAKADAAVVVVRRGLHVLCVHSQKHGWMLPGGKVEAGEDHFDAAQRELREETGMSAKNLSLVRVVDHDGRKVFFSVAYEVSGEPRHTQDKSVDGYAWVTVEKLMHESKFAPYYRDVFVAVGMLPAAE